MSNQGTTDQLAKHESSVRKLYQDEAVAEAYIENRFTWTWSRLLHETQVNILNRTIAEHGIRAALELAPGPARLTTHVEGIERGVMVEASPEMVQVARRRLSEKNLDSVWDLREGDAFDLASLERSFELIYTFRFIRHFESEERDRLYKEISRRLEPSGLLIFDVVNRTARARARAATKATAEGSLPVYDAIYTEDEFRREMDDSGFEVLSLHPVLRRFGLQSWISYKIDRRVRPLANLLVRALESIPGGKPLEWVAVARKKAGGHRRP